MPISANWEAATALRHRALVRLTLPRMADFARWAKECDPAPGPAGTLRKPQGGRRRRRAQPHGGTRQVDGKGLGTSARRRMIAVVATAGAPAGQKIRRCPRAATSGRSFACGIEIYSVEMAEQEPGQSLVAGLRPRPSGLSAPSARFATTSRRYIRKTTSWGNSAAYKRH